MEPKTKNKEEQAAGSARQVRTPSPAVRYSAALLLCGIAAGIDFAFPTFSAQTPIAPFYLATSVAAWFGGFRAGLLASVVSVLVIDYYFTPLHGFNHDPVTLLRMGIAGLLMVIVSWLIDHRAGSRQLVESERGQVEAHQRRLQAMLSSAARIAGMGSWEYDIANDRVVWDDETHRIFGTTREAFGGNTAAFFALVHPDDRDALKAIEAKASGGITEMEYRIIRPDGVVRTIHDRGQVTRHEAGKPVQITGMVMDVTEQRRIERALRESEERFRLFMDNSPAVAWMKDDQGRYVYLSQSYMDRFAVGIDQWRGKTDYEVRPFREAEQYRKNDAAVLSTGKAIPSIEESQANGETSYWLNSKFPVQDSAGQRYVAGVAVDITEQHRAKAALRSSEERWRAIFENSAVGIALADVRGTFTLTNRAYQKMVGYTDEELRSMSFLDLTHEEDRAANADMATELWQGKIQQFQHEKRYRCKDGKLIWVRNTVSIAPGSEITPRFAMAIVEDVTERRSLEEQVRQSQKMEAVGRLAGGVAHDFNNMLNVILGHCELLGENLPATHPQQERLNKIKEAATRSANLTGQLLAFSRKQLLMPKVLDLNATVGELTSMLGSMIGDDIELVIRPGKKLGLVKADPGQIEQVIMNLAVNSRDAMPSGGQVVIETSNVEVGKNLADHQPVPAGSYVMLSVSDTGCGIRPEIKDHIFEPFYTTKEQGQGTGLGLSMVYGIVEQSDGYIRVSSESRRGATFEIYLPRAEGAPDTNAAPAEEAVLDGEETILIAEDEPMLAEFIHILLESAGYTVLEAHNGEEAVALAQKHNGNVDLLLTDVVMSGGTNGLELAANLGSLQPGLKVLYMTGYTADLLDQKGVADLQNRLLQKPFSAGTLRRKIREVLAN